jgi:hypothetical protein
VILLELPVEVTSGENAYMPGVLALAVLLASTQGAEKTGSVRGAVRVERVLVDAYVTTRSGEPIPDLTAADFRVTVAGQPVELESVEWIPKNRAGRKRARPRSPGRPDA